MKIEVGKTYETRDGRLARVICTDRSHFDAPIMALVPDEDGDELSYSYRSDGLCVEREPGVDLIREHVPVTYRWYRVFDNKDVGVAHPDKPDWDSSCVGLIKLAFDPNGNLVIDKCEITGAQPNG